MLQKARAAQCRPPDLFCTLSAQCGVVALVPAGTGEVPDNTISSCALCSGATAVVAVSLTATDVPALTAPLASTPISTQPYPLLP